MCYSKLKIGDAVPLGDGRSLIHSAGIYAGHPRWYALMVTSQKEAAAEAWLSLRGVYSFHPVTYRDHVLRGKRIRRESRYLPGFVFARFPGRPVRHRVMNCPFISDALRVKDGQWGVIVPNDIRKLHAMRATDDQLGREKRDAARIKPGDRAMVLGDRFYAGREIEVREVRLGRAKFILHMFGADREIEANVDQLHKIG